MLGQIQGIVIKKENDYEVLFVANMYRPLTKTPEEALEVMREIEAAGGLSVTAIVNNSNLGEMTDAETVTLSERYAERLSELSGLPIKFTAVKKELSELLGGEENGFFPMELQQKYF